MDQSIASRAGVQAAPGGSYARYLGQVIAADLRNAGALDDSSALKVGGTITHAELHSPIGTGHGELAAHITLSRHGVLMFEKSYDAKAAWPSDLVGAAAIPDAFNHYMGLFDEIALDVFNDPEFSAAARAAAASH